MNKFNIFNLENLDLDCEKFKDLKDIKNIKDFDTISDEKLKSSLPGFSSDKLCQIVVAHRYLGFSEDLAILAMEELGKRRVAGDSFDFESCIDSSLAQLPPLNFNFSDIKKFLSLVTGLKK